MKVQGLRVDSAEGVIWQCAVKDAVNLCVPYKGGNFLISRTTVSEEGLYPVR